MVEWKRRGKTELDSHFFHHYLHNELEKVHIQYYQYLFFDRRTFIPPVIISTFPSEWLAIYQEQKLYYTDPIIHQAKATVIPFAWSSVSNYSSAQMRPFFKQMQHNDIIDGYTFVVHDALGNTAILNLLSDEEQSRDFVFFEAHRAELQILLIDLYDHYLQEKKNIEYHRTKVYLLLSEKERNVLVLGARGLKYKEIARRLAISERTVKFHMSKIIEKLDVETAKSAFIRSKELNII